MVMLVFHNGTVVEHGNSFPTSCQAPEAPSLYGGASEVRVDVL
jgi:hypothetical protein